MSAVQLSLLTSEPVDGWNPYFVAYAASRGATAAEVSAAGGWAADFMAWMTLRWAEWLELAGIPHAFRLAHADEFGAWLAVEYPEVTS